MKRMFAILLTMIMALALSPATAQEAAQTAPSPIRLGGTGDDDIGRGGVMPLSNGNLLLSLQTHRGRNGQPETGRFNSWTWLLCLKPDGSTVWETEIGEEQGAMGFYHMIEQPDGTVTGYVYYSITQHAQYRQRRTYSLTDGSLIWQGEQESDQDPDVYVSLNTVGSYRLRTQSHGFQTGSGPRFYQLEEADGTVIWRIQAETIGLKNCDGMLPLPQGTLLYGGNWAAGASGYTAKALLIDEKGNVLWTSAQEDLPDARFGSGLAASGGRVLLAGGSSGPLDREAGRYAYNERLLVLLDAATGKMLWRKLDRQPEENPESQELAAGLPVNPQLETEQGFLLADNTLEAFTGFVYQLIGPDGSLKMQWQTAFRDTTVYSPTLFRWNNEIWSAYSIDQDGQSDVILERVKMPE